MKKNKLIALLLSPVLVLSIASCDMPLVDPTATSESAAVSSTDTKPTASETTEVPPDLEGYKELTVAEVTDQDDGKITIYAHNSEFIGLAEKYAGIKSEDYDLVELSNNSKAYQTETTHLTFSHAMPLMPESIWLLTTRSQ